MNERFFAYQKGDNWSDKGPFEQQCYLNDDYLKYSNFSEMITYIDQVNMMTHNLLDLWKQKSSDFSPNDILIEIFFYTNHISQQARTLRDSEDYELKIQTLEELHSKVISNTLYQYK